MESNREEAQRALEIAHRKRAEGDIPGAIKFAKKSQTLFSTPQVQVFLEKLSSSPAENGTPFASGTATPASTDGPTPRKKETEHRQGRQTKEFTTDQVTIVERVRKCKHHQYYEILELETQATDSEIKKSYRRMALQLHPDKNGAPGADEAFKMVSRAFQVLSDPDKRAAFDRHGEDPDSRTAGMGASPFSNGNGFPMRRGYGGGFDADELSPDDLFNMFFGGGGFGGGGFNAGPFGAQFGGPGIRVHTFGGGRPRRQQQQQPQGGGQPQQNSSLLYQLLPVLILLAITILPTLFTSSPTPPPSFVFDAKPPHVAQRTTPQHSIPFFVDPAQVSSLSTSKLRQLDQKAELVYIRGLRDQCQVEYESRQHKMMSAHGWWGGVRDKEAYDAARATKLPSCDRLRGMGYRTEVY